MQPLDAQPRAWRSRVFTLLNEQIELYASLESLSSRQGALIADEDADALLEVLSERQRLIERAQRVADELAPYRRRWSELQEALPASERDALNARVEEAARLVDSIAQRDERDRRAMEAQRAAIATRMRDVHHARGAMAAYAGLSKRAPEARYQDREG